MKEGRWQWVATPISWACMQSSQRSALPHVPPLCSSMEHPASLPNLALIILQSRHAHSKGAMHAAALLLPLPLLALSVGPAHAPAPLRAWRSFLCVFQCFFWQLLLHSVRGVKEGQQPMQHLQPLQPLQPGCGPGWSAALGAALAVAAGGWCLQGMAGWKVGTGRGERCSGATGERRQPAGMGGGLVQEG